MIYSVRQKKCIKNIVLRILFLSVLLEFWQYLLFFSNFNLKYVKKENDYLIQYV